MPRGYPVVGSYARYIARRSVGCDVYGGGLSVSRFYGRSIGGHLPSYGLGVYGPRRWRYPARSVGLYRSALAIAACGVPVHIGAAPRYMGRYYAYAPTSISAPNAGYVELSERDLAARAGGWRDGTTRRTEPATKHGQRRAAEPGDRASRTVKEPEAGQARLVGIALRRGDKAFEEGRYADAREEYVRAVVLADGDAGVRIALGIAEFALGRFEDASRAVREGVARTPGLASTSFDLRDAYRRPGDFAAHLAALEAFVHQNAGNADALFLLGFIRHFSGDRAGAAAAFAAYRSMPGADRRVARFIQQAREAAPSTR